MSIQLKFHQLAEAYSIVRLAPDRDAPAWAGKGEFTSVSRTTDELSIVCPAQNLPEEIDSSLRWICFRLQGPFPFSLTGVLLSFIEPLSENGIPIFTISTFDTDYVLVPAEFAARSLVLLADAGHTLCRKVQPQGC